MKRLRLYSEADLAEYFCDTWGHPDPAINKRAILHALIQVGHAEQVQTTGLQPPTDLRQLRLYCPGNPAESVLQCFRDEEASLAFLGVLVCAAIQPPAPQSIELKEAAAQRNAFKAPQLSADAFKASVLKIVEKFVRYYNLSLTRARGAKPISTAGIGSSETTCPS